MKLTYRLADGCSRTFSRIFLTLSNGNFFPQISFVPSCPFRVTKVRPFHQKIRGKIPARPANERKSEIMVVSPSSCVCTAGGGEGGFGCRSRIVSKPASFACLSLKKKKRTPFRDYRRGRKKRRIEKDGLTVLFYLYASLLRAWLASGKHVHFSNISHYFPVLSPLFSPEDKKD